MKRQYFHFLILTLLGSTVFAQDTVVVQTLTFDSITTRRGVWDFPTGESFRKILMVHTLKCDPLTQHDQYPCGEWDYLTYNVIYQHTGIFDSILYFHPNFTFVNGLSTDSVLLSDNPVYDYFNHTHVDVSYPDTMSYEYAELGWWEDYAFDVFPAPNHSGRSQYLWKVEELTTAGFSAGLISGIKLYSLMFSQNLNHVMVRIGQTNLEELTPDTLFNDLDTVFYNNVDFVGEGWNNVNFSESFYWDGVSNLIVDFSFTDYYVEGTVNLFGSDPGFNCGISSGSNNYALDFDGKTDFVKLPSDTYFNSDFTFEAWINKRNNNTWSRVFDFGNGPNQNNVIVVLSNAASGKFSFHINNEALSRSFMLDDPTPLNEWIHVTLRLTAHMGWVYINGEQVKLGLLQQPDNTERSIDYIGRSNWPNDAYADMLLDEFRLYNTALTPEEIKTHYRQPLENPEADPNLIAYFKFDEGQGSIISDSSSYNHNALSYGLPTWYPVSGPEIYMGFKQSNLRPWIQFQRLESSSINIETTSVLDSVVNGQLQIVRFDDLNDPTIPTDTLNHWEAGWRYVYENWLAVDSIWVEPDEILYKEELPYYGDPFEVLEQYEIGRFITPYGINLSLGPQGFSWIFDVTDYAQYLQGEVDISAGNQQELIDLKFIMIKGTPPRDVLQVDRIWGQFASYSYKNLDDDISLPAITMPLLPEAEEFKVKTRLTGHGHNSNTGEYPHCCEWKDNEHYLLVNSDTVYDWHIFQYHDCGLNPVYPQGGTWPGAREGWCPGDLVTDHEFEISEFITGNEVMLDYDITPVPANNLGMGNGNYVMAMHLIQYNESNFEMDAEIYDVISPANTDEYSRKNPVCYDPAIVIRNNGTTDLTSLTIEYGVSGGIHQSYLWSGTIQPHRKDTVLLPVTFSSFWLGDSLQEFRVKITDPNGFQDEYNENDEFRTHFNLPDMYDEPFIMELKTNNQAYRYNLQVRDVLGNTMLTWDNLENNTVYSDTLDFPAGCYTIELIDQEDMGLTYWAYPEQGWGYLEFNNLEGTLIKNFNPDFGRSIFYTFNIGDVSYIQEPNLENTINVHPNPFYENVYIDFEHLEGDASISVYNVQGKQVYKNRIFHHGALRYFLEFDENPAGVYVIQINTSNQSFQKKVVKK